MARDKVLIKTGITGDEQQSGYMNGTLQHAGCNTNKDEWAYTIHTYLDIPSEILKGADPQAAIAEYIGTKLHIIADSIIGMSFEVEVGPTEEPDHTDNKKPATKQTEKDKPQPNMRGGVDFPECLDMIRTLRHLLKDAHDTLICSGDDTGPATKDCRYCNAIDEAAGMLLRAGWKQ